MDASLKGYGGTYNSHYIQGTLPELWETYPIDHLELFPIYILFEVFKTHFSNLSVKVLCDNAAVVHILNKLTAKDPKVMHFVRRLVLKMLKHNIRIYASHLPGDKNTLCDALSRQTHTEGLLAAYGMDHHLTPVPSTLRPQNWRL